MLMTGGGHARSGRFKCRTTEWRNPQQGGVRRGTFPNLEIT